MNNVFYKILLSVVMVFFFLACAEKINHNDETIIVDIEQRDKVSMFDFFDRVEIIPLQTTDSSLIVSIDKLIPYKDKYYLFDYRIQKILAFDASGKFLFNVGNKGGVFTSYGLNGNFIEKHRLPVIYGSYTRLKSINDDTIAFWTHNYENRLKLYSKSIKASFYEAMPEENIVFNSFSTPVFPYENYVMRTVDNQVYEITSGGILQKAYRWDFGSLNNEKEMLNISKIEPEKEFDYVKRIHASEVINYFFSEGGGNSIYTYAQLRRKNKQVNIFHHKESGKNCVFEETTEGARLYPMYWTDDYIIGICPAYSDATYDNVLPDAILSDEELLKKRNWDELDNPLLIKYYFKKE